MALRNIAQKEEEMEIPEGLRYTHPLIAAYHTAREKSEVRSPFHMCAVSCN